MFAKRIVLRNFKSFSKATLELDKSFTSVVGPNGSGKSCRSDTEILLPSGEIRQIGELVETALEKSANLNQLADGVLTLENPENIRVLGIDPETMKVVEKPVSAFIRREGEAELYKIRTKTGREVVTTGCHPILVFKNGTVESELASNLSQGHLIATPRVLNLSPTPQPINALSYRLSKKAFAKQPVLLDVVEPDFCRFLGYLVGDGYLKVDSGHIDFTNADAELLADFTNLVEKMNLDLHRFPSPGKAVRLYSNSVNFVGYLENVFDGKCVGNEKHIPKIVMESSDQCIASFLAALFDCDGHISKTTPTFEYVSSSSKLAKQVQLSLLRFGIVSRFQIKQKYATNTVNKTRRDYHHVYVEGRKNLKVLFEKIPLKCVHKKERLQRWSSDGRDGHANLDVLPQTVNQYVKEFVQISGIPYKPNRAEFPLLAAYVENRCNPTSGGIERLLPLFEEKMGRLEHLIHTLEPRKVVLLRALDQLAISRQSASRMIGLEQSTINDSWVFQNYAGRPQSIEKLHSLVRNELMNRIGRGKALLRLLKTLCNSDIFWDQIESIEKVPGEKWVYDLTVPGCKNFIGNGIFVHNSNVVDSLLFSFGEMRLKSLRVKSTKDLIFKNANVAEVCVLLVEDDVTDFSVQEVEEKGKTRRIFPKGVHEIRRLIRKDGKTRYMLDGRAVKKYVIEDFLTNHSISLHHVIKQGEVQRIIEMNPKDRRQLIDFVANVSEYEEKKQESFLELGKVDVRLKEAQTVFAEREGYLRELEHDKKNAEKYLELEKSQRQLAATLIHIDLKIMEGQFESLVAANLDYRNKVEALQSSIKDLESTIDRHYQEKDALNKTIVEQSQGREAELQRAIGALQSEIDSAKSLIEDRKGVLKKMDEKRRTIRMDHQRTGDEVKGFERQFGQLNADVESVRKLLETEQGQLDAMLKKSDSMSNQFFDARKRMQQYEEQMQGCKDQLNQLQVEASRQQELEKVKEHELIRLKKGIFDDYAPKKTELTEARRVAKSTLSPMEKNLADLFAEERELNQRLPALENQLLDLKEKMAVTEGRLRVSSDSSSRGLEAVMALREKNKGIFGTLGELVQYSSTYSLPVSVALGNRLQYVVVDSVKTAGSVIDHLKANDLGRVSFIPLDKIQAPPADDEYGKKPGAAGMLIDLLEFDSKFKKAVAYACSNTVVFGKFKDAEKWAGKCRMVTQDGELFEPSGLVSGGKTKEKINVFAEQAKLAEYSKTFEKSKVEKDALVQRLYAIREEMSGERKKKAESDLQLKKIELELEHVQNSEKAVREQQKDLHAAMSALETEIAACRIGVEKAEEGRADWVRKLSDLNVAYLEAKQLVDVEKEKHFGDQLKEKEHKVSDLKINLAGLENELRSITAQKTVYARQYAGVEKEMASIVEEEKSAEKTIADMDARVAEARKQLKDKTEEQKSLSKELKGWIEKREELDAQISQLGNQKGKFQFELEKLSTNRQDSELKRVAVETKLSELKVQYEEFKDVPVIQNKTDKDKGDLVIRKKEAEDQIKELGTVNLRAPELYVQKADELERQKVRVVQLENEKNAVLSLIAEIETKKKATFMETFESINASFKRLFKVIFKGDGTLFLENAEDPFAGGLTIQVQLENKEVKYLELMSGGEKSLIALLFLFAIQARNPSSIYILDEADAALDQENSRKLAMLLKQLASHSQFLVVSHNETLYKHADCLIGVAMGPAGSRLVEVKLNPA